MNKTLLGAIVAVVIILGAVMLMNNGTAPDTTNNEVENETSTPVDNSNNPDTSSPVATDPEPQTYTISITDTGYAPNTLTIKKGDSVTFNNNGTKANWPASAPHPTHTDYPEFDPKKAIEVGGSWLFTFNKVGTWKFHDHLNATKFGSITVTE